ncbi:rsbT co-antagonist protein RsbR [Azospirillum fermentarium]|uniref:STAS domain-containing protein n=1 Tax=Azospirillum fermentarium TaxID=1233114 RepID=UPI002225DC42|nr:STAS domain-containing protein [Azospirillum fermentarium]MCW2249329.1 rsbT co-antagonist protein RsbR [Azospirillum fermentarium]
MTDATAHTISAMIQQHQTEILKQWLSLLIQGETSAAGRIRDSELQVQCHGFLDALRQAIAEGNISDIGAPDYSRVREVLGDISRSRALMGFSPTETATFVLSLKQPLFDIARQEGDKDRAADALWALNRLLDALGLFTMDVFQQSREAVIIRQQQEIAELSTPVVKLWQGILALPLIGTLDSSRTQVVMENLLQSIVDHSAEIAIIDITGVPTVDTLVAQHLLKTIAAARLMGADCIISGVRPQIAQTMVHLGVELNVTSKATMADAFALALLRTGRTVADRTAVRG